MDFPTSPLNKRNVGIWIPLIEITSNMPQLIDINHQIVIQWC